jgi:arginine utilization protein RocB
MPTAKSPKKKSPKVTSHWFSAVRAFTEALVAVRSVSPGAGEIAVAETVIDLLRRDGLGDSYAECGLVPIAGDPFGRQNAFAYLPGQRRETVVLLGHIDTVGTEDYGALEPLATNPEALAEHLAELLDDERLANPTEWLWGRGALDMKSGVAVNIAIMRHFAAKLKTTGERPPLSLVLAATPDEEMQSAGALATTAWLAELRVREQLQYLGLINTDYVAPRFEGDPERPIYTGTIGKLLPLFFVVGKATHVGDPYGGLDANLLSAELVRDLAMNPTLVDRVRGAQTPPPVTLHQADLKTGYNTQTAFAAWFYLNVLTMSSTPAQLLQTLQNKTRHVLTHTLEQLAQHYRTLHGDPDATLPAHLAHGQVWTFAELRTVTEAKQGVAVVQAALEAARQQCPASMDSREATLHLIRALWQLSGERGPAVVIAYAPPFYPHIAGEDGPLTQAVQGVVANHAAEGVVLREFFPLLSDLSYMRLDPTMETAALSQNMPLWQATRAEDGYAGYHLPFELIDAAQIEGIVNIGVFGQGGHQRGERVHMPYSFETVPQMVHETILAVAATLQESPAPQEPAAPAPDEEAERLALRENATRVLRDSRVAPILQEMNKALLKGRGWFDEYDSGVIMKWGTGYTRRHIWVHIQGDDIRFRLRQHRICQPGVTPAQCDGEYHTYARALWSDTNLLKSELKYYYDHAVAESSDD